MKNHNFRPVILICIFTVCTMLCACGAQAPNEAPTKNNASDPPVSSNDINNPSAEFSTDDTQNENSANNVSSETPEDLAVMSLRIVDGADTGELVLAGEGSGDVYTLKVQAATTIYLDGKAADASALEDGMMAEITYSGDIQETYPARLGNVESIHVYSLGSKENSTDKYDLCGLYLQVLNDLWEIDLGLNRDVTYVSVDLSQAPGELTDGEKAAIAWIFAGEHQAEGLNLSYDELAEQGYFTQLDTDIDSSERPFWQWDDGVLFTITTADDNKKLFSLATIHFNVEKWRGPLGAYFFTNCSATWGLDGRWDGYKVGAEAIS